MGRGARGDAGRTDRVRVVVAGAAGILLMTLLASTLGSPIAGTPTRDFEQPTETRVLERPTVPGSPPTRTLPPPSAVPETPAWMYAVILVLLIGVAGTAAYLFLRWAHRMARARRTDTQPPPAPIPPEVAASALLDDTARHVGALEEGRPDEAIIATWVALERSVARAGVERRPAETSSELTLRVLGNLKVDGDSVATLAELYREARYSRHAMTDEHRDQARTALRQVHDSLRPGRRRPPEGGAG